MKNDNNNLLRTSEDEAGMMQRHKGILLYGVFMLSILFLTNCSQNLVTVAENLSRAAAISPETSVSASGTTDASNSGSSFVKIVDEDIEEDEEDTENQDALFEEQEEDLDKRIYREGDLVAFDPVGVDPDGDLITYQYSRPLDEKGRWQTTIGDAGTYLVTITASDGKTEVEKKIILLILSANRAPTIEGLNDITVPEGTLITLNPNIFDYNSDEVTITYSKPVDQNGNWQTEYDDSGTYLVKVSASDSQTITEKQITIIVTDANRAPVIEEISHVSTFAGERITLEPKATDPDGDPVTFSFSTPFGSDGTWQTTEDDIGTYAITVTANDGKATTEKLVTVILNHKNKAPVISLDEVRAEETDRIVLKPTIIDPEGDEFTATYSALFDAEGVWVTDYDDAGEYTVAITAIDEKGATSSLDVKVVIYDKNRAPVFKI